MLNMPNEIICLIFDNIPTITDKRQFIKTCKFYNIITKKIMKYYEDNFTVKYFTKIDLYCVEKFTLELCYDKYFNMIPLSYINPNNKILIKALASFNCIELLQIAKNNGCALHSVCAWAAWFGHFDIVKWGKENGSNFDSNVCASAAFGNNLEILKWIVFGNDGKETGCKMDIDTCSFAACNGNLEIIKWAREHGAQWNETICCYAAQNGHLETLKWARKNGCPWNTWTCADASGSGHLNVLKWAIENGCGFNLKNCIWMAEKNGHTHIIDWLKENVTEKMSIPEVLSM